ncbi:MAG TPA: YciI family protein [Pseudonocardiaceae bacterium]|nr:YciI family protein [Pseudonocardiaceae bacterium]
MTQYLLSVIQPHGDPPPQADLAKIMQDVDTFHQELKAAGAWVFARALHDPSTATVVRFRDGDTVLTDGPFAEGKEHLGGLCIVKAPDLDSALEWGRRAAQATTLPIEVRPFHTEAEE